MNIRYTLQLALLALLLAGLFPVAKTAAQAPPPSPLQSPVEMPIRGGSIVVKVADYGDARRQVLAAAQAQGAEMLGAKTLVDPKGRKHGWVRLRLPAAQMPLLLDAVGGVGRLYGEKITTTDHASEYEELARRITRLQQHETRLSGILESGHRLRGGDLLFVQERLFRASVDESLLAQRRADLARDTQLNTLLVELFEPGTLPAPVVDGPTNPALWFPRAMALARAHLGRQATRGATLAAYALVYAPFWLPALLLGLLLLNLLWSRRAFFFARLRVLVRLATALLLRGSRRWRLYRRYQRG